MQKKHISGFTLIELLVVIGILAVLLSITLIAINPARQFSQANDTKRRSDVNAVINAVNQYMADNNGTPPAGVPAAGDPAVAISTAGTGETFCTSLVTQYIAALPQDPQSNNGAPLTDCASYASGYTIARAANNRITVSATGEITANISVTR